MQSPAPGPYPSQFLNYDAREAAYSPAMNLQSLTPGPVTPGCGSFTPDRALPVSSYGISTPSFSPTLTPLPSTMDNQQLHDPLSSSASIPGDVSTDPQFVDLTPVALSDILRDLAEAVHEAIEKVDKIVEQHKVQELKDGDEGSVHGQCCKPGSEQQGLADSKEGFVCPIDLNSPQLFPKTNTSSSLDPFLSPSIYQDLNLGAPFLPTPSVVKVEPDTDYCAQAMDTTPGSLYSQHPPAYGQVQVKTQVENGLKVPKVEVGTETTFQTSAEQLHLIDSACHLLTGNMKTLPPSMVSVTDDAAMTDSSFFLNLDEPGNIYSTKEGRQLAGNKDSVLPPFGHFSIKKEVESDTDNKDDSLGGDSSSDVVSKAMEGVDFLDLATLATVATLEELKQCASEEEEKTQQQGTQVRFASWFFYQLYLKTTPPLCVLGITGNSV